jgi:hypothetical protein
MNLQENDSNKDILEFNWDKKEEEFSKREVHKSDTLAPLEPYLEFLKEIGALKGDRTLSKIYPEPFSL